MPLGNWILSQLWTAKDTALISAAIVPFSILADKRVDDLLNRLNDYVTYTLRQKWSLHIVSLTVLYSRK